MLNSYYNVRQQYHSKSTVNCNIGAMLNWYYNVRQQHLRHWCRPCATKWDSSVSFIAICVTLYHSETAVNSSIGVVLVPQRQTTLISVKGVILYNKRSSSISSIGGVLVQWQSSYLHYQCRDRRIWGIRVTLKHKMKEQYFLLCDPKIWLFKSGVFTGLLDCSISFRFN